MAFKGPLLRSMLPLLDLFGCEWDDTQVSDSITEWGTVEAHLCLSRDNVDIEIDASRRRDTGRHDYMAMRSIDGELDTESDAFPIGAATASELYDKLQAYLNR